MCQCQDLLVKDTEGSTVVDCTSLSRLSWFFIFYFYFFFWLHIPRLTFLIQTMVDKCWYKFVRADVKWGGKRDKYETNLGERRHLLSFLLPIVWSPALLICWCWLTMMIAIKGKTVTKTALPSQYLLTFWLSLTNTESEAPQNYNLMMRGWNWNKVTTSNSILTPTPTWRFTYVLLQSL